MREVSMRKEELSLSLSLSLSLDSKERTTVFAVFSRSTDRVRVDRRL